MTAVRDILEHLTRALGDVGRYYPATADPPKVTVSHTRTAPASKPPIPAAVLSLRRDTSDRLGSWAMLVAEERDLRPGIDVQDVPALVGFLTTHVAYLAGHEAGEDALREISTLAYQLEEVARQSRPARVRIGPCPEVDCEGSLTAVVRKSDALLPSRIRCDSGEREHEWLPSEWGALGRRLGSPEMNVDSVRAFLDRLAG